MQLLFPLLLSVFAYSVASPVCIDGEYTAVDGDCTKYSWCVHGSLTPMTCAPGTVWNDVKKTCVHKDSADDICSEPAEPVILPNPMFCQMYFALQQYMECDYPQLFNAVTLKCDDFWNVLCGDRKETKYICDYHRYGCQGQYSATCRCRSVMPNCEGLEDGLQYHSVKVWSPYYVDCRSGRVMAEHECPMKNNRQQIFHPGQRRCALEV